MLILLACAGLMSLFLVLALVSSRSPAAIEQRLQRLGIAPKSAESSESATIIDEQDTGRAKLASFLARFGWSRAARLGSVGQSDVYGSVRQRLGEAGFRRSSAVPMYMGSRMILGAVMATLAVLTSWALGTAPPLLLVGMAAAVGYILPGVVVDRLGTARRAAIQRGLANAIDLMAVCVEAGLGLSATIARVSKEFEESDPILAH